MKVLVTGGAGFIGSNLVAELVSTGHEVVVLDDLSTGSKENLIGLDAEFIEGSILDDVALSKASHSAESIVHLAARPSVPRSLKEPLLTNEVNVNGTLKVLEAARNSEIDTHVIVASSSSVYGRNPLLPKIESMLTMPVSPYAVSKLATEQYALAYAESFGLKTLPFRFFNVYGPMQKPGHAYAAVVPAFLHACLTGMPIPLHGDGTQSRDFTNVSSVTSALRIAVEMKLVSQVPVNLAFGTRASLLDVLLIMREHLGLDFEIEHLPNRLGDVPHSQAANELLSALIPDVKPVELRLGIAETWKWMKNTIA
jgi:UDP-glucose 4-epimerase